ncbi:hypothetical protein [Paenibacillus sp. FSL R7-0333]|uniref:hypothetical protein n=1 Tax=Paenibacillus sp. FSL R7-0333 TaxID=1926587 RepID=UPI00096D26B2|nr:hypothetical protein BK146_28405 [Paenibacillus sp. FSL R7-0333]
MLTIQCTSDFAKYRQTLSPCLLESVSQELYQLCELLTSHEDDLDFWLDTSKHTIDCMEQLEPLTSLKTLGLAYPFVHIDYVEIYVHPEVQYYRVLLLYDNESFKTVFSLKGTQNTQLEEWLANQAIHGEAENQ